MSSSASSMSSEPHGFARSRYGHWEGWVDLPLLCNLRDGRGDADHRLLICVEDAGPDGVTDEQQSAIELLATHEAPLVRQTQDELLGYYARQRQGVLANGSNADGNALLLYPVVTSIEEFRGMVSLAGVYVSSLSWNGSALVGLDFDCIWATDRGVGVIVHAGRVVAVGSADLVYSRWRARRVLDWLAGRGVAVRREL